MVRCCGGVAAAVAERLAVHSLTGRCFWTMVSNLETRSLASVGLPWDKTGTFALLVYFAVNTNGFWLKHSSSSPPLFS